MSKAWVVVALVSTVLATACGSPTHSERRPPVQSVSELWGSWFASEQEDFELQGGNPTMAAACIQLKGHVDLEKDMCTF
jgi:hypothetical protein